MNDLSLNELVALSIVLKTISLKDLLLSATENYYSKNDSYSKEKAIVLQNAVETLLD
jgi:hypothetical protein